MKKQRYIVSGSGYTSKNKNQNFFVIFRTYNKDLAFNFAITHGVITDIFIFGRDTFIDINTKN